MVATYILEQHSPVMERALNLYLMQQRRYTRKNLSSAQHLLSQLHKLRHCVFAIPNPLL
jgi:hypothetical protein